LKDSAAVCVLPVAIETVAVAVEQLPRSSHSTDRYECVASPIQLMPRLTLELMRRRGPQDGASSAAFADRQPIDIPTDRPRLSVRTAPRRAALSGYQTRRGGSGQMRADGRSVDRTE
jgi:hypothetical protein